MQVQDHAGPRAGSPQMEGDRVGVPRRGCGCSSLHGATGRKSGESRPGRGSPLFPSPRRFMEAAEERASMHLFPYQMFPLDGDFSPYLFYTIFMNIFSLSFFFFMDSIARDSSTE